MNSALQRGTWVAGTLSLVFFMAGFFEANARPAFAKKENKKCVYCHLNPGGGARGFRGIYYKLHEHSFTGFDEKSESKKAGCKQDSTGEDTKPTKTYPPNGSDSDDQSPPPSSGGGRHGHHRG